MTDPNENGIQSTEVHTKATVCPVESQLDIVNFSGKFLDQPFSFQILFLLDSYYIWIGQSIEDATMSNLSMAMNTRFEEYPLCSTLFGDSTDTIAQGIAKRLSKFTKKQIYLSYTIASNEQFASYVERHLIEQIKLKLKQ